ncbi:MAG: ribonuclease III [Rhabdochlamydiaceae bacterium]|nr:ribonuclease III [Candidatus Amphrikana amoebophyrae]
MNSFTDLEDSLDELQAAIGYQFKDTSYLTLACTHSSYINEHKDDDLIHNERIEFLGDAILGLIISEVLYLRESEMSEGKLSSLKSLLVEAPMCHKLVEKLDIGEFIVMGVGESRNLGNGRSSVLADFFEALLGAIYLDGGFEAAKRFYLTNFKDEIDEAIAHPEENPKVVLQDLVQKLYKKPPEYVMIAEDGPGHEKKFEVAVIVNGQEIGRGYGMSKKKAQKEAAKNALMHVREHE